MKYKVTNPLSMRVGESRPFATSSAGQQHKPTRWPLAVLAVFAVLPVLTAQAAVDDVGVDQSPLIVSDPLPPNIMLMYDDSGSMGRDYLPDNAPQYGNNFRKSTQNRQYYNPTTLYTVPLKADGSSYPEPQFPFGYDDPFNSNSIDRILTKSKYSDSKDGYAIDSSYTNQSACESAGGHWKNWNNECRFPNDAFVYYDGGSKHHVVADGGTCSVWSNCHHASDTLVISGETTTYGQNVANFYSYYRQRDLSAKSGIFNAFSDISPSFRVGFGSINNNNESYITNNFASARRFKLGGKWLAGVERLGKPSEVGNGVQRERFWAWLEDVNSNSGTPLRKSLKAVGDYYADKDHPWESGFDEGATYSSAKYSCRPSFSLLISDGTWNGDSPSVGNVDGSEAKPFYGNKSNYLADVALEYWKDDLRTDLDDDVPVTDRDQANWQHMSTFTVGLGVEPSLNNDGGGSLADIFNWARTGESGSITTSSFSWGSDKIADMAHAAINGRGDFFSARDPEQFANGIKQALAAIAATPGSGSSPTFSGGETLTSSTRQYTASYVTGAWTGELTSVAYDDVAGTFSIDPWSASAQLPTAANRNIWTINKSGTAVEFKQDKLSDYLKTLGDNLYVSDPKGEDWGKHIVNYLRGDQRYEDSTTTPLTGGVFRKRDGLLGDIVNGTPVVIGAPAPDLYKPVLDDSYFDGLHGTNGYEKFATDNASRTSLVYVAANDGMLHAFNAQTGKEVFAYIPGAVVGGTGDASLARLANPEYGVYSSIDGTQPVPHQYFHDGRLTTQNVYIGGKWKTILVGTTGRGTSRTVYALDITNPADLADPAKAKDAILWERSAGDGKSNADWIGMALGRPTISLIKGSSKGKWVVHLGNGPNSEENKAALLQFDLATGDLSVYPAGTMTDNGLAAPYVIQKDNSDGVSEYAFAGDLQGNVWRFDLSPTGGSVSSPIYIAKDDSGSRQPITVDMFATQNEATGAVWVFFGTGRFLTDSDIRAATPQVQTWYGLRALKGPSGLDEVSSSDSRTNLQERKILAENTVGTDIARATSLGDFSDLTTDSNVGWFMDLESPVNGKEGERIVYQTQLIAGRLIVNTLIPKSSSPCETFPAGATLIVDPFSGGNPGEGVVDANGDGKIDDGDSTTLGGKLTHYNGQRHSIGMAGIFSALLDDAGLVQLYAMNLAGGGGGGGLPPKGGDGERLNWQEIFN
ncbi:pilus assembly protein [Marinobacter xestospongiae]|uniref:PilC/PilY family type IV pilus protein n=1 Tax=Marinobacter xestospongiae TaxID=994319 RepID=A0ABU3W2Z2_9GAMM|nr:PilC/PilY family type IV pilus protein [Marinobacter xestospongiae]MDV2080898.1 PilC/PilY family type IV pilus protein [Marinobacter xestospongiae]